MNGPALVVMARAPEAGKVKTRMLPYLTPEQCVGLYSAFLGDAIDLSVSQQGFAHFVAFTPVSSKPAFMEIVPFGVELIPQVGIDLGTIMDGLMNALISRKYSPVVLVGSDIPTIQPQIFHRSLALLKDNDICFGPSRDGGYYLVGASSRVSAVFQGIPWSTSRVLELTMEKVAMAGLKAGLLEELNDNDNIEDLKILAKDISRLRRMSGAWIPVRTEEWLKSLDGNFSNS